MKGIKMNSRVLIFAVFAVTSFSPYSWAKAYGSLDESQAIIADVHMHPHPHNHPSDVLSWMDRNGVKWAGMGEIKGGRSVREHYAEVMGDRYINFGGQSQINKIYKKYGREGLEDISNSLFKSLMKELEQDFKSGKLKGIGEVFANARTTSKPWRGRKMQIDAQTNRTMLDLVAKYGGAMTIHVQWDDDSVLELGRLAEHNKEGNIIMAHCGSNTFAEDVRSMLAEYSNIYCDLSARHRPKIPDRVIQKRPHQEIFTSTTLDSSWKRLIEDMPDRFMVGTDTKSEWDYDKGIENIRSGLLSNLSPEAAKKVAYKNAERLLDLQ